MTVEREYFRKFMHESTINPTPTEEEILEALKSVSTVTEIQCIEELSTTRWKAELFIDSKVPFDENAFSTALSEHHFQLDECRILRYVSGVPSEQVNVYAFYISREISKLDDQH